MTDPLLTFDPALRHWQLTTADGLLMLTVNRSDSTVNTLNAAVLREFSTVVDKISQIATQYRGLLLVSGKDSGFIAGADIETIRQSKSATELKVLLREVHDYFARFAALPLPKVALIDGFCLGGGLELALCCDYRVISKAATLGLPEVKLGLHPGFAGTARLLRLLPPTQALPMLLQGYTLRGRKAVRLGLADELVGDQRALRAAAEKRVKQGRRQAGHWQSKLLSFAPLRTMLANKIAGAVAKKVRKAHYPAPYAILDLWRQYGGSFKAMADAEIDSFVALRQTPQADALIRLYFLQERLKRFGKNEAAKIQHVHVIGAGTMGGDIAAWSAMRGTYTTLSDLSQERLEQAAARAYALFDKKLRDEDAHREATMRLRLDKTGWGLDRADLIIEAVVEDLEVKQAVLRDVLTRAKPDAVVASNTSSLRLEDIAAECPSPERLVGLHFFNPVAKMPLVEVVHQPANTQAVLDRAARYVTDIGRLPLPVQSSPGFLVNRVLVPYLFEALRCYQDGINKAVIDQAAEAFGMPMGPIELADRIGLDVCQAIAETMRAFTDQGDSSVLDRLVADGHLGRKTGQGFYTYTDGKAQKGDAQADEATRTEIQQRLIMCYLNACAWCLRQGVVEDIDLVDAGCVFGTGFAPFRGGPMYYAQQLGFAQVRKALQRLADRYGARFTPDAWWDHRA